MSVSWLGLPHRAANYLTNSEGKSLCPWNFLFKKHVIKGKSGISGKGKQKPLDTNF